MVRDLPSAVFEEEISAHGGPLWVVVFYANWCPHCKMFAPQAHQASLALSKEGLVGPADSAAVGRGDAVALGAVDCALAANEDLCTREGVHSFPSFRVFRGGHDVARDTLPKEIHSGPGLEEYVRAVIDGFGRGVKGRGPAGGGEGRRDAGDAAAFAAVNTPPLAVSPEALRDAEKRLHLFESRSSNANVPDVAGDLEKALAQSLRQQVFVGESELHGDRLYELGHFLQLSQKALPNSDLRRKVSVIFDALRKYNHWTADEFQDLLDSPGIGWGTGLAERSWSVCSPGEGGAAPLGGFTCGLWQLFHTLLANCDEVSAARMLFSIDSFVKSFFKCADCSEHFSSMWEEDEGAAVKTKAQAVLWLWRAHNKVSARVARSSADATKHKFPSLRECPPCYQKSVDVPGGEDDAWDSGFSLPDTLAFLQHRYCQHSDVPSCRGPYRNGVNVSVLGALLRWAGLLSVCAWALLWSARRSGVARRVSSLFDDSQFGDGLGGRASRPRRPKAEKGV